MHYIVQENVFKEHHYDEIIRNLERLGLNYDIVRIFPFVDKIVNIDDIPDSFNVDDLPEYEPINKNKVWIFGSVKLARVAAGKDWAPGSMLNNNHDFMIYKNHYKENLLNCDSQIINFGNEIIWDTSEKFIRPTKDSKVFTGKVFDKEEWDNFVFYHSTNGHSNSLTNNIELQVSSVKNINKEIRFWVIGGKIITGSQYRLGNQTLYNSYYEAEAEEFAQKMVDIFKLAEAFVIDVCLVDSMWKIVECNCINGAGFYNSNIQKMIIELENHFDVEK